MCPCLKSLTQKSFKGIKKYFDYAHFDIRIYQSSPDTLRNSTTVTMLIIIMQNFVKIKVVEDKVIKSLNLRT